MLAEISFTHDAHDVLLDGTYFQLKLKWPFQMKARIRKVFETLAGLPVVGRFVRIGVGVIRLPELQDASLDLNLRQHALRDQLDRFSGETAKRLGEGESQLHGVLESVGYLLGRVEFVRRELMFEMRYGASSASKVGEQMKAKTEIISLKKVADARKERLCLNLGCGHVPLDRYLNVDRRALPGVDIVAEVDDLPFEQGEVDEIFSAHLLEHFPEEQLRREILPYWIALLRAGGALRAVVPDAEAMMRGYAEGTYPYSLLREVTFGAQDYDGDFHFNMFTPSSLVDVFQRVGLVDVEIIESGRMNGGCYEFEIVGVKRGADHKNKE